MPYRVSPDGTIETDTVDEAIGVAKAIAVDSILGIRYSRTMDPTEEFLRITDEIVKLVQQKSGIEAELEVLLQRQRELLGKKSKPPAVDKKIKTPPVDKVVPLSNPPEMAPGYYAVIGREILHANGTSYFGDRLVVYKWGCSDPHDMAKEFCTKNELSLDLNREISIVPLTKSHVEVFEIAREPVFYCRDFGIERPK
jgi:hypothetical protein